jgi:predicted ArsR family transcriptional regulator
MPTTTARQFGATLASPAATQSGDPAQQARAVLADHGFEPDQDEEGTVVLRNCPFHQLALGYPDVVCGMNLALLEGVVNVIGASGLRPVLDPAPGRCCVVIRTDEHGQPPGER